MGLPQENAAGYDASSVLTAAKDAHGRMLIVYGTIDENVHPQNSLQLAYALQNAGVEFELMPYPGNRHGVVLSAQRRHLYGLMTDFLRRNL
jgi:dipeptidyl-peptidase-4